MTARIAALFRHPIKGFTPEKLEEAQLVAGAPFPGDRLFALEDGPSGFDDQRPGWIPKQKFAVLATLPAVARAKTRFDEASGVLEAEAEGLPALRADLTEAVGQAAFAAWVADLLGEAARGPVRLLSAAGHRFLDHPLGHVSVVNLASVRELGERLGQELDPLRFRANVYVEGWEAWAENAWEGRRLTFGEVEAEVFKTIVRCAAPDVNPATAIRDVETTKALFDHYGHMLCGIYLHVKQGGTLREGDAVAVREEAS